MSQIIYVVITDTDDGVEASAWSDRTDALREAQEIIGQWASEDTDYLEELHELNMPDDEDKLWSLYHEYGDALDYENQLILVSAEYK